MVTVLVIGIVMAVLSYLFHPDVGQFSMTVNGEPIPEPFVRFAALPTALLIMLIAGILGLLLFFGVGLLMFFSALLFAILGVAIIAPFFWPVLVIIVLISALTAFGHDKKD